MDKVYAEMAKIADEVIQHYKTDFTHWDTESYGRMYEGTKFIWLARECGSYILAIPSYLKNQFKIGDNDLIDSRLVKPGHEMTLAEYLNYHRDWDETIINHYGGERSKYFLVTKGESIVPLEREKALQIVRE